MIKYGSKSRENVTSGVSARSCTLCGSTCSSGCGTACRDGCSVGCAYGYRGATLSDKEEK